MTYSAVYNAVHSSCLHWGVKDAYVV